MLETALYQTKLCSFLVPKGKEGRPPNPPRVRHCTRVMLLHAFFHLYFKRYHAFYTGTLCVAGKTSFKQGVLFQPVRGNQLIRFRELVTNSVVKKKERMRLEILQLHEKTVFFRIGWKLNLQASGSNVGCTCECTLLAYIKNNLPVGKSFLPPVKLLN